MAERVCMGVGGCAAKALPVAKTKTPVFPIPMYMLFSSKITTKLLPVIKLRNIQFG